LTLRPGENRLVLQHVRRLVRQGGRAIGSWPSTHCAGRPVVENILPRLTSGRGPFEKVGSNGSTASP
jgi:hypothetical protein